MKEEMVTRLRAEALQPAGTETRRPGELHRVTLSPYLRVIFEVHVKIDNLKKN